MRYIFRDRINYKPVILMIGLLVSLLNIMPVTSKPVAAAEVCERPTVMYVRRYRTADATDVSRDNDNAYGTYRPDGTWAPDPSLAPRVGDTIEVIETVRGDFTDWAEANEHIANTYYWYGISNAYQRGWHQWATTVEGPGQVFTRTRGATGGPALNQNNPRPIPDNRLDGTAVLVRESASNVRIYTESEAESIYINCSPSNAFGGTDDLVPPGSRGDGSGEGDGDGRRKSCESRNSGGLDWMLCGVINFIDKMLIGKDGTSGLLGEIDDLLNISDQYYSDEGLIKAWSYFRNIASLALVLIGLLMVIGQAISKE